MLYRVKIFLQPRPKLEYIFRTWWVEANIKNDDKELKEKILFGLNYNKEDIHLERRINEKSKFLTEIVPFPHLPESVKQEEVLNINNSLKPWQKVGCWWWEKHEKHF